MFTNICRRFTYANVAVTVALVFAMTGGAYAAGKYLITSTKQISPKVIKQLTGKTGAAGNPGAGGPAGLAGPGGPVGPQGVKGDTGAPGENGGPGPEGKEGSPWTAGGTLPSGKTETGTWGVAAPPGSFAGGLVEVAFASISFTIPLKGTLPETRVHVIAPGAKGAGEKTCPTTSTASKPEAELGNLCIFEGENTLNVGEVFTFSADNEELIVGRTGVIVRITPETKGSSIAAFGTWALTAE